MPLSMLCVARAVLMLVIAVQDARTRTLPNGLAIVFGAVCGLSAASAGWGLLARDLLAAALVCGLLSASELLWRARHDGAAGLGMGDIKYLFCLMLADPWMGLVSFAAGLLALAVCGAFLKKASLPLLPFAVGAYLVVLLASSAAVP